MHPDTAPFGHQARLYGGFLPALPSGQQPASQAAGQWWELGTSIQTAMVKSLAQMVTHL